MAQRVQVAVVQGGPSTEAEVSRASARGVADALLEAGHSAQRLELDARLPEALRTGGFDVVFPVAHGAIGEDGSLQGLLELLGLPYVGSGVLASALSMDKAIARRLLGLEGLPVARGVAARRPAASGATLDEAATEWVLRARREVSERLVVKPASQGSALGVVRFGEEAPAQHIATALVAAWTLDDVVLLEHFARGREITCGVLDVPNGAGTRALPPTEIASPEDDFYTFEARYTRGRSVHTCPAEVGESMTNVIQAIAVAAHRALGCRDLSRVDLILGDGPRTDIVTLLEVNTMPGFTPTSLYPEAAARAGVRLPQLCDLLVESARCRGVARRHTARPIPT